MKKLVIFGGRGIGMIATSIANDLGYFKVLGFLNDVEQIGSMVGRHNKVPVIGKTEDYINYLDDKDTYFFIGYVGLQNEKQVYEKISALKIPPERFATLIHPTAIIPKGFCSIGNGVLIAPLAIVSPDTTIGDNCMLLANSILGHDATMERFAHIGSNSVIGGKVLLGKAVHIGTNATLRENITIGDYALVGAGSVVLQSVEENTIVAGNPARLLRKKK